MKMPGKCTEPKCLSTIWIKWRKKYLGPMIGEKSGQARENMDLVQETLKLCEAENETKIAELLQARTSGHQEIWQDVKTNLDS